MNKTHLYLCFILIVSCSPGNEYDFEKVDCIESGISYTVFKPCRQLIFRAKYWDKDQNLISDEKIWVMANGKEWIYEPEQQNEIVIQYEYDESKMEKLESYNTNLDYNEWASMEVTGVIENETTIWMHPFRKNQYSFMQVAPYPNVSLPLEVGKTWTSNLNINNWGVWSNSTVYHTYEVVGVEMLNLEIGALEVWHIHSQSSAHFGNSTHNFWFHPALGFVKMLIHNYAKQTLEIELVEILD